MNKQNLNYEELYDRLLERGETLHRSNQKRIRIGLIFLAVFTVAMIFIRWLTGSDRVVFMVIWVIGMFASSIYLIGVEYIDNSIQKTLEEVTERETSFSGLIPDSGEVRERIQERIQEMHEERQQFYTDLKSRIGESRSGADGSEESQAAEPDAEADADAAEPVQEPMPGGESEGDK